MVNHQKKEKKNLTTFSRAAIFELTYQGQNLPPNSAGDASRPLFFCT